MVNLYKDATTNTFSIYPETGSTDSSFTVRLTQDLDLSSTEFTVTRINSTTTLSDILVLQSTTSNDLPDYTGQYTFELFTEGTNLPLIWGTTTSTYSTTTRKWGDATSDVGVKIDTDRAFVYGSDQPTFTEYTTTNEVGRYTTYHG